MQNLGGKLLGASEEILVRASTNKKEGASLGILNLLNSHVWSDLVAFFPLEYSCFTIFLVSVV